MWFWIIFAAAILVLLIARVLYETHTFRVQHYEVHSTKFPKDMKDWKIVFLSDLHNHEYGKGNEKLLKEVKDQHPDAILVGGDMLIRRHNAETEKVLDFMEKIARICPVYCANGNHEQKMKENTQCYGSIYEEYKKALCDVGIHVLENRTEEIYLGGMKTRIGGLEIPVKYYDKGIPGHKPKFEEPKLEEQMKELYQKGETDEYNILLAHQPLYAEQYAKWGIDLILSGHLHGGMVRIPGIGGVISPQLTLFPKYSGEHKRTGDCDVIVSKGLGMHSICIRLFNRAEVVVVHGRR
nr:metallophosphoesterase [uncultured Sellimonas sp.]